MIDKIFSLIADEKNFIKTIDKFHAEIHEGDSYSIAVSTSMVASSTYFVSIKSPDSTTRIHLSYNIASSAVTTVGFYSTATTASTWVSATSYNLNRASTKAATAVIRTNVPSSDTTSTGALLESFALQAGNVMVPNGGYLTRSEWILARNATYLLKVNAASTTAVTYNITWYEQ